MSLPPNVQKKLLNKISNISRAEIPLFFREKGGEISNLNFCNILWIERSFPVISSLGRPKMTSELENCITYYPISTQARSEGVKNQNNNSCSIAVEMGY
jgi:hypothetical protein